MILEVLLWCLLYTSSIERSLYPSTPELAAELGDVGWVRRNLFCYTQKSFQFPSLCVKKVVALPEFDKSYTQIFNLSPEVHVQFRQGCS
jgi:hypothetical protein